MFPYPYNLILDFLLEVVKLVSFVVGFTVFYFMSWKVWDFVKLALFPNSNSNRYEYVIGTGFKKSDKKWTPERIKEIKNSSTYKALKVVPSFEEYMKDIKNSRDKINGELKKRKQVLKLYRNGDMSIDDALYHFDNDNDAFYNELDSYDALQKQLLNSTKSI